MPGSEGVILVDPLRMQYILRDRVLEAVSSARYLGVHIYSNLSWKYHVNRITAIANRSIGFIKPNIKTKSSQIREMAYQSLVHPQLEYASTVWDPHTKKRPIKLKWSKDVQQRWTLSEYVRLSSVTSLQSQLNWQTL